LNSNRFVDLEPGPPITLPSIERRWQLDSPSPHPPAIEDELVARIGEELARDVSVEIGLFRDTMTRKAVGTRGEGRREPNGRR
jgi:hypothetical protein